MAFRISIKQICWFFRRKKTTTIRPYANENRFNLRKNMCVPNKYRKFL